jgi:hypothetical protein
VSQLSRNCAILSISQPCRLGQPVTGIALLLLPPNIRCDAVKPPFKVSFENSAFELPTDGNLKWRKFNIQILDVG